MATFPELQGNSADANSYTPKSAMVIVAHPDDAEFLAAGTVAKWCRAGAEVTYAVVQEIRHFRSRYVQD